MLSLLPFGLATEVPQGPLQSCLQLLLPFFTFLLLFFLLPPGRSRFLPTTKRTSPQDTINLRDRCVS